LLDPYRYVDRKEHEDEDELTEQLEDIRLSSSEDDETKTYDVDKALAAKTPQSSSSASATSDEVAPPVATAEPAVCEVCLLELKARIYTCTGSMWTLPLL